jgi:hypothetical protein
MGWQLPFCPAAAELDAADMLDIEDTDSARCRGTIPHPDPSAFNINILVTVTLHYTAQPEIKYVKASDHHAIQKTDAIHTSIRISDNNSRKSNHQDQVQ